MKKTYCIYHRKDFDGVGSFKIIERKLGNVIGIPYDNGDRIDEILTIPNGSKVFMVDISVFRVKSFALVQ